MYVLLALTFNYLHFAQSCNYCFGMFLIINSDYFRKQQQTTDICNGHAFVFFVVGTKFLNIIEINFGLQTINIL